MQAEVAVQLSEQRGAATDQQAGPLATPTHLQERASCLVCFEEQRSDALAVQLPCGHPTCQTCWQVSCPPCFMGDSSCVSWLSDSHLLGLVFRASWKRDGGVAAVCPPYLLMVLAGVHNSACTSLKAASQAP